MAAGKKDKNSRAKKSVKQRNSIRAAAGEGNPEKEALNHEQLKIVHWLKTVQFRKKIFGGVEERDVWKKIEELNAMYEAALSAERERYDVLLRANREATAAVRDANRECQTVKPVESAHQKRQTETGTEAEDEKV